MKRLLGWLVPVCGLVMALGAIGHSLSGAREIQALLEAASLGEADIRVVMVVWHLAGAAMVLFGVLVVWAWRGVRHGNRALRVVPAAIGALYLLYGASAVAYTQAHFFHVFVVLGTLLLVGSLAAGAQRSQ